MIYGVVCVQLAHFGLGDWEDISTAYVIIIIKSEVSALPIGIIFSVVVWLKCLLHHILSLIAYTFCEKRDFVFISASSQIRFGLQIVFIVCTLPHLIIIVVQTYWNCKMPVRDILSSVWVRLSIFSQLSIIQYTCMGLCVFSLPIPLVMIERIHILCLIIIIKSEVWTITHCLGLGHNTMVIAVCLSICLFFCDVSCILKSLYAICQWFQITL